MAMGAEKSHTIDRLPSFNSGMLPEPLIAFGGQHKHVDPKTGLALYGPYSLEGQKTPWPKSIIVGIVGPASMISDAEQWLHHCQGVLTNDGSDPFGKPHFPGFDPTFQCELLFGATWNEAIKRLDLDIAIREQSILVSIKRIVTHYAEAIRIISERDQKPNVILCCIPQNIIDLISRSANKEVARQVRRFIRAPRRAKKRTEDVHAGQLNLFKDLTPSLGIEEEERGHQNLRRGLKAEAMQRGIPTQLVWPRTFELYATKASPGERSLQDVATRAWNFAVALYYKAGGTPWRMAEIDPETCFVGVSFYTVVSRILRSFPRTIAAKGGRGRDFLPFLQADTAWRKLRPIPPEQAPQVEDRGLTRLRLPRRRVPPGASPPGLIAAGVPPTPPAQGDQVALEGAQGRLLRPGQACFHPQALVGGAQAVLLPEARRPGFHPLGGRQLPGRPGRRGPRPTQVGARTVAARLGQQALAA
jgi:hypothetical protein